MTADLVWLNQSNSKTGKVPGCYVVGPDNLPACGACPLKGGKCYAERAQARGFARLSGLRAIEPNRYTLQVALDRRLRSARFARFGIWGNPSEAGLSSLWAAMARVQSADLQIVGYEHNPLEFPALQHELLGSTPFNRSEGRLFQTALTDAEQIIELGWKAAVLLPSWYPDKNFRIPGGGFGIVCPAQLRDIKCNDCLLCSLSHPMWASGKVHAIGFKDHRV